jgi:two-component system, chemotaxis family, CheB/CheR fusion protein
MTNSPEDDRPLFSLLEYLKRSRNFDFSNYKRTSLERRLKRSMQVVGIERYDEYQDFLEVHPEEFSTLFNSILINVTGFFRDPLAWNYLQEKVIPTIIANKLPADPIRIWSAGCASGEEPFTLAMVFAEILGKRGYLDRVKIYATDIDEEALSQARRGIYSEKDLQVVPGGLREKYFVPSNAGHFNFDPDLRRSIIFGRHDLFQDAPISRLDLLVCRNTLMYFNADIQGQILPRFHFATNDYGYLFLGKAELLLKHTALFTPLEMRYHIFSKAPNPAFRDRLLTASTLADNGAVGLSTAGQSLIHEAAFNASPQPQIVIDLNGNFVAFNGAARDLFGLTLRDLKRPFRDNDLSYRPVELRPMIDQAYSESRVIVRSNVIFQASRGEDRILEIQVLPLQSVDGGIMGVSIVFTDMTHFQELKDELQRYNHELETAYEELQSSNEELETANEELQSAVEELETTNEELQSSNEEMETMNEELQSTNEEMQTVNDEMHTRTADLDTVNAFLQSILGSLNAGVAVVDRNLNVRIWNRQAENLWGLRSDEVLNQSFLTLDIGLPVEALPVPFRSILDGKTGVETRCLEAVNRRGKKFTCQVVCNPLLTLEKNCQGLVIVMEQIDSDAKVE